MPRTPRTRARTTTPWQTLHATHHLTPWRPRHHTHSTLSQQLSQRFGLHNAGAGSGGFWREWAAGCVVAQCAEGVFMFSHGFGYACLVAVEPAKAAAIIRGARDAEMEGAWRRAGGGVYDARLGGQWPGDGGEGEGEGEGGK